VREIERYRGQLVFFGGMASHSWESPGEVPGPCPEPVHSWEGLPALGIDAADNEVNWGECSDDEHVAEEATSPGAELVSLLLQHLLYSRLTAAQVCILMWWAEKRGIDEDKPYALRPGASTGRYGRKMKSALGHTGSTDVYELDIPGHARHDLERSISTTAAMPLHEQIAADFEEPVAY